MDRIALSEEGATTKGIYDVVNLYNNKVTKVSLKMGEWIDNTVINFIAYNVRFFESDFFIVR